MDIDYLGWEAKELGGQVRALDESKEGEDVAFEAAEQPITPSLRQLAVKLVIKLYYQPELDARTLSPVALSSLLKIELDSKDIERIHRMLQNIFRFINQIWGEEATLDNDLLRHCLLRGSSPNNPDEAWSALHERFQILLQYLEQKSSAEVNTTPEQAKREKLIRLIFYFNDTLQGMSFSGDKVYARFRAVGLSPQDEFYAYLQALLEENEKLGKVYDNFIDRYFKIGEQPEDPLQEFEFMQNQFPTRSRGVLRRVNRLVHMLSQKQEWCDWIQKFLDYKQEG